MIDCELTETQKMLRDFALQEITSGSVVQDGNVLSTGLDSENVRAETLWHRYP